MIRANDHKWNNFFCRRVHTCSGCEGQGDDSFEMENFRRGEHLFGVTESRRVHNGVSAEDDRALGGEGVGGQSKRHAGSIAPYGTFFKSRFFWMRQAREDQSQRQVVGACGDKREGCLGGQVFFFRNMVGGSA